MKHNPVSPEAMEVHGTKNSICQVLRDIYHATNNPAIREKCRLGCAMGKAMTDKITELTGDPVWFKDFWDDYEGGR